MGLLGEDYDNLFVESIGDTGSSRGEISLNHFYLGKRNTRTLETSPWRTNP